MSARPFTVVMPAYNAERTLDASVRSVLAQTRPDFELIIVDDGSTDGTPAMLQSWSARDARVRVIRQPNQGPSAARNAGIAAAEAPYIAFLDSDDLWMPTYIAGMTVALDAAPEAGFAYTDAWQFSESSGRIRSRTALQHYPTRPPPGAPADVVLLALIETNFVMSSATCRADALADAGGYDTAMQGAEDWDLWIRIVATGRTAALAPGCLIIGRDRAGSVSKNEVMMWSHMRDVVRRVAAREDLPDEARRLAREKIEAHARGLARAESGALPRAARHLVRRARAAKARRFPGSEWRTSAPSEVAAAFPQLARDYGKPFANSW